ncbi:MAG TPA: hypothetical protein VFQ88_07615 [Nevskiaceae bacterium]|nr:hypothetical protein [Nevskiaceae bacterium]
MSDTVAQESARLAADAGAVRTALRAANAIRARKGRNGVDEMESNAACGEKSALASLTCREREVAGIETADVRVIGVLMKRYAKALPRGWRKPFDARLAERDELTKRQREKSAGDDAPWVLDFA